MKNLDKKFRQDKLAPDDLQALKRLVNEDENDEVESVIFKTWMEEEIDTSTVSDLQMDRLKATIDSKIDAKRFLSPLIIRCFQIAATILLPIFMIASFYLYHEKHQLTSEEMIVSTEKGERANITLPDGTKVSLNSESKLCYNPRIYNSDRRTIRFEGEGYFQVEKDKERPFLIEASGLKVKVLGTSFNLNVRDNRSTAELALVEGSVLFSSLRSEHSVILEPNQKAILNQRTGEIVVISDKVENAMSWKRGELIFRNTVLSEVIQKIESNYGVSISMDCKDCLTDLFTGTLSASNLNETLGVLERVYHLKATMNENVITFTKKNK